MACHLRRFRKETRYPHKRSEGLRRCLAFERNGVVMSRGNAPDPHLWEETAREHDLKRVIAEFRRERFDPEVRRTLSEKSLAALEDQERVYQEALDRRFPRK